MPEFVDGHLLSHSAESCFRACPRRYYYQYELGLRPRHDSDALRLGSAVHTGLEAAKVGGGELESVKAVRDAFADAACPPWLTADDYAVEEEKAVALVVGWMRRYADDGVIRFVAAELPFDLPARHPQTGRPHPFYRNAGKIDAVGELPDGRLALVEHKTTTEDVAAGSDYWKRLMLDAQISRYWAAAHELGYPVSTVVYDVIRKPQIRPKLVSKLDRHRAVTERRYYDLPIAGHCPPRETPKMYGARLLQDLADNPGWYFARNEIPRLETDLREFALDQWAALRSIESCRLDGYWPRNTSACTAPYRCAFLDVCRGLRGNPDEAVPDGFRLAERLHPELETPTDTNSGDVAGKERT